MNRRWIVLVLMLNYFLFGLLLNSVGIVILQSINSFGISKEEASLLEGFKDIPIAIMSFMVASILPRLGYRKAMIAGMSVVTAACALMPMIQEFWAAKLLFLCIGSCFAVTKLSVYAKIGIVSVNAKDHASLINVVEGVFMFGVLSGYWVFSAFIDSENLESFSWLDTYWVLTALCALNLILLIRARFGPRQEQDSSPTEPSTTALQDFLDMLRLVSKPLIYFFVISLFFYVLIEQGINSWLPTFNSEVLGIPAAVSVQVTSIFALCLALGRLGAGALLNRLHWYILLSGCVLAMATLVVLALPLAQNVGKAHSTLWLGLPPVAFVFPLIGLFMAPIYPSLSSAVLSSLPVRQHSAMTGLITIFSAFGGTTGSLVTGAIFSQFSGEIAFYTTLIPMAMILVLLFQLKRETERMKPLPSVG